MSRWEGSLLLYSPISQRLVIRVRHERVIAQLYILLAPAIGSCRVTSMRAEPSDRKDVWWAVLFCFYRLTGKLRARTEWLTGGIIPAHQPKWRKCEQQHSGKVEKIGGPTTPRFLMSMALSRVSVLFDPQQRYSATKPYNFTWKGHKSVYPFAGSIQHCTIADRFLMYKNTRVGVKMRTRLRNLIDA